MVSKKEKARRISTGLRKSRKFQELERVNSCVKEGMSVFEIAVECGFTPAKVKSLLKTLANLNHLHNAGEVVGSILGGIGGTIAGAAIGGPTGAAIGEQAGQIAGGIAGREIERATRPKRRKK